MYEATYTRVHPRDHCGINGRMPKGILIADDAKETAQFVAAYAGQIGTRADGRHIGSETGTDA